MEIDETNESQSKLVMWILIVSVASIVVAFALGIGGMLLFSQQRLHPVAAGFHPEEFEKPEVIEPIIENSVSAANGGCTEMDTEPGTIEIIDANLPCWDVLPLCITPDMLQDYYVTIRVTGGYEPECGSITFIQKDEVKGTIGIAWDYLGHEPCYADYWQAHFVLCDNIELESNQWPVVPDGLEFCSEGNIEEAKKVTVCLCTYWTGCHFWIMLIQKKYFRSPPTPNETFGFHCQFVYNC
ncbi:MAG: hypothetical protein ACFFBI_08165 [Promethearchaeota archaeon]